MGAMLNEKGIHYLDTTVGGSSQQVREGTAIIMAGGGEHLLESVRPILSTFAKEIFHMGPTGSGSRMKVGDESRTGSESGCPGRRIVVRR